MGPVSHDAVPDVDRVLATPVIITYATLPTAPQVSARQLRGGVLTGTGNAFGDRPLQEVGP